MGWVFFATRQDFYLNDIGVSRQTFYNHFRDKNDLIPYIYLSRIIVNWRSVDSDLDYCRKFDFQWHQRYYGDKPMPDGTEPETAAKG